MTEETERQGAGMPACGHRLRQTREELGLSVEDVAGELHLSHFQIEALESDDWDRLPGTTYARGYLKAYARLLGLDAEQLLSGASTEEIEISRVEPAVTPSQAGGRPRTPWAWIAGVALICALVLIALEYRLPQQLAARLGGGSAAATQAAAAGSTTEADGSAAASEHSGEPATGSDPVGLADGAASADRPPMPTVPRVVVFEFEQRSWIDVRDARGERLLYRDFHPGRRIEVEGEPPFQVFLGNAHGVQVEYLGEIVAPDTDPGRLYARFVLGAPSG